MRRRFFTLLLCLCLFFGMLPMTIHAEEVTGTVYGLDEGNKLYVRKSASTSATILDRLSNGDVVTILDTVESGDYTWYKIRTKSDVVGYSTAAYIRKNVSYQTDKEFEAYLKEQKFPESYKVKLRKLWAQHPTWVFKAQHLSMTWEEALTEQTKPLKNGITEPDSWKSMEEGTYSWSGGYYLAIDSGGWVTAAPDVVAYYLDPRNFLDETYLFQFEDLQLSDGQTVEGIKAILPSRFDKHAKDLLDAAKEAGVSAYFLATRMAQEGSKIDGTWVGDDGVSYKGYYNFFNYGAYAGSQYGTYHGAVTNGAIYAKKQGWDTPYKCLVGSAKKIGSGYINKGQNTLYYQKFNVAGENLHNHQYMCNVQAPAAESKLRAAGATDAELNSALTFIIPVYQEMPDTSPTLPKKTGNNNNFLDSLTTEDCTLSPTFDRYTMEYTGEVDEKVESIQLSAVKNASGAKISGAGTIKLKKGENTIPITVTATSGQVRTYTVTILRGQPDPNDPGTTPSDTTNPSTTTKPTEAKPTVTSTAYRIGETVVGIEPGVTVKDFLKKIQVKNGTATLYGADGKEKKEGTVATGDLLKILDSKKKVHATHGVVIYGDANGDGKINSQDLRRIQRHILGVATVKSHALTAADVNMDGKVNSQDLRRTQRYILKLLKTLQPDAKAS